LETEWRAWIISKEQKQGWAIPHFENVCLLFFCAKKVQFGNLYIFCTFLHIRSFQKSKCSIALFCTFSKSKKFFYCTFLKSGKMWDCTFSKSNKVCDCTIALSKWGNVWKCAIKVQILKLTLLHFKKIAQLLSRKGRMCKNSQKFAHFHTFAHFKRAIVQSHFFHTFSKSDKKCDCTFTHF